MATLETRKPAAPSAKRPNARRVRVVIRRVSPLSVLKFSLIFYFCLMLVVLIGLTILYFFASAAGWIEDIEGAVSGVWPEFNIDGSFLFWTMFIIGAISSALWSLVTVFVAFLYNLIADLVGGLRVTLSEDDVTS